APGWPAASRLALLEGWGQGLKARGLTVSQVWDKPAPDWKQSLAAMQPVFEAAGKKAGDGTLAVEERLQEIRLTGYGPFPVAEPALRDLLAPQAPAELQAAAVRALANHDNAKVGELLLAAWKS